MADRVVPFFDPSTIPDGSVCLFLGKRGSGKSTLIRDVMSRKTHLNGGVVISYTEEANQFYSQFIPPVFVQFNLDLERLGKVLNHQKTKFLKYNSARKEEETQGITPDKSALTKPEPIYIILDDCMFASKEWIRSKVIKELLFNGRHYGIFLIVAAQYVMSLTPEFRTNIDYVFITRENDYGNLEKIYKSFFGVIRSKEEFFSLHDTACRDYGILVSNATSREGSGVYWYKAKQVGNFRVGSSDVWAYAEKILNEKKKKIAS